MQYPNIHAARFIERPNRFIARVELDGQVVASHVKNTGRCRELLLPGAQVFLCEAANPLRKTRYDLVAVQKGKTLINMDSAAPNAVFAEWALQSGYFGAGVSLRAEVKQGDSRLDFCLAAGGQSIYAEVKGVTLEENGIARFPDAPTLRGIKHLEELCRCTEAGHRAVAVFIIQMRGVHRFEPNDATHPAFGDALRRAAKAGVELLALDCDVTPGSITAGDFVPVCL